MTVKKPKLIKLPKRPKRSASIGVLERYIQRVAEVRAENARRVSEHKRKLQRLAELRRRVFSSRPVTAIAKIKRRRPKRAAKKRRKR